MRGDRLRLWLVILVTASCGGVAALPDGGSGGNQDAVSEPPSPVLELLAGDISASGSGSMDGTGSGARFNVPFGVAVDSAGDVYVADTVNNTIRKITPAGVVTTLAGVASMTGGSANGTGAAAQFNVPRGLAVDGSGNLYVADFHNNTIRKITPAGLVTTVAGIAGMSGSGNGSGAAATFNTPGDVAVDSAGNIYVADTGNSTIRKITSAGNVTTFAGAPLVEGSADGSGARFIGPHGVAVDSGGNLYVADTGNSTIRKLTPAGVAITVAGTAKIMGGADGNGSAAQFNGPFGVAVDSAGNVYVADTGNSTIRKVTPVGAVTTIGGVAGMSGVVLGTAPRFMQPKYLAIVGDALVISDANAILLFRHVVQ